ncbi:MAG: 6-carboxytetrahydropterin synthase [Euryarchaeota archaeon]|nr:6-carboxytetrahydropterin synthase [Euryarchaeota archaeon]
MYRVGVKRPLSAMHFFDVSGPEGEIHSHPYQVELVVAGDALDSKGYLVDIDLMTAALEAALERFEGKVLNDLTEFSGISPSIEHLSKIIWEIVMAQLKSVDRVTVIVWEDDDAWASYEAGADE